MHNLLTMCNSLNDHGVITTCYCKVVVVRAHKQVFLQYMYSQDDSLLVARIYSTAICLITITRKMSEPTLNVNKYSQCILLPYGTETSKGHLSYKEFWILT